MNGVVMAGGSALRSFAPILSGFLSTYSYGPTGPGNGTQGSLLVYGVIS
eukprot:CAMPEP_0202464670 /NCGR_PEP_ID=MMETSP1360-20130828/62656_1 /ASSEMBLY_ACC=CAM_ASM_000848 /TAXON_ID=515479 /ORGANISM="Licmophora paradoxa, Strain CCMP2313" /LENGTH=48 /DNA_ID= /DNA_START= /DNA_END= /DNA_ORIENTATION=